MSETPMPVIYQLKVLLLGISPMIWRRIGVRSDSTIADLHYIIQIAMGWKDEHLHQFLIHGVHYGISYPNTTQTSDASRFYIGPKVNKTKKSNQVINRVKTTLWLVAEIWLNFLVIDNLADYSEFIFEKHVLVLSC